MGRSAEPLTESYFYILLCLYDGPSHGIGSGTMYGATSNMMKKGWIEELPKPDADRRRLYRLTDAGRQVLLDEAARLRYLSAAAANVIEGGKENEE